jgi:general secretion pathway protein F/type IV pilus assembly protein PilC
VPTFRYTALNASGARVVGVLTAPTKDAAAADLDARRLVPVSLMPAPDGLPRRRVSDRRLAAAYLQAADLLDAGVPLLRALTLLGSHKASLHLASAFAALADHVREGGPLADAMAARPDTFPPIHVAMIRAGERGGFLDSTLRRLGQLLEAQADLRAKLLGGLIYPAVLVSVGLIISAIIFTVFVPKFRVLFRQRLDDLPLVTDAVFFLADVATRFGLPLLVLLAIVAVALSRWRATPKGRRVIASMVSKLPVLGPLSRTLPVARFCRTLGTLLESAVPMLDAMRIARAAADHPLLDDALTNAEDAVRAGKPLAHPLSDSGMFDADTTEMISVGESSGRLPDVLLRAAAILEARIARLLAVAVQLVEPALLLAIALVVAFVAAGLILPLTQLSGSV